MSPLGLDFPAETFVRTPIRVINRALDEVSSFEQATANINSISTATLANLVVQVAHAYSGSKRSAPKSKPQDFLPFPHWSPLGKNKSPLNDATKKILADLLKQQRIPMHVFTGLMTPPIEKP